MYFLSNIWDNIYFFLNKIEEMQELKTLATLKNPWVELEIILLKDTYFLSTINSEWGLLFGFTLTQAIGGVELGDEG